MSFKSDPVIMKSPSTPNIQTARIICGALMGGVVLFWAVAFAVSAGQGLGAELPLDSTVLLAIVLAISLGAFGAAFVFRSKAVRAATGTARSNSQASTADSSGVLTNLIIAWALLEGQALMAGVLFMLTGNATYLIIPALVFIIGFAVTFPRPDWFARPQHTGQP